MISKNVFFSLMPGSAADIYSYLRWIYILCAGRGTRKKLLSLALLLPYWSLLDYFYCPMPSEKANVTKGT